jgi:ribosomal protein S10
MKGFATLPCRKTRHTMVKAPMAHKTFSQEQFMIKYYFLNFRTTTKNQEATNVDSIDKSALLSNIFYNLSSFAGTNMLVIYKVKS